MRRAIWSSCSPPPPPRPTDLALLGGQLREIETKAIAARQRVSTERLFHVTRRPAHRLPRPVFLPSEKTFHVAGYSPLHRKSRPQSASNLCVDRGTPAPPAPPRRPERCRNAEPSVRRRPARRRAAPRPPRRWREPCGSRRDQSTIASLPAAGFPSKQALHFRLIHEFRASSTRPSAASSVRESAG